MLRLHFLQHWFNLSDPSAEEALYDLSAMRRFAGIDLGNEPVPDETTICKFRHLLEAHDLGARLFELIAEYLESAGLKVRTGGRTRMPPACLWPAGWSIFTWQGACCCDQHEDTAACRTYNRAGHTISAHEGDLKTPISTADSTTCPEIETS